MNSESERKYSLEELKQRNLPPEMEETPSPTPICPTEEQWRQMLGLQVQTVKLLKRITEQLDGYPAPPSLYPVTERLAAMEKELSAVRQAVEMIEQAGRKKERRLSLPRISLPRPTLAWLFIPMGAVALWVIWRGWNVLWTTVTTWLG